jgi:predicted ferric reductase
MKRPLFFLALLPLALWSLFALPGILDKSPAFWEWRRASVILSGILALWWMSAGMLLAARPAWLEGRFGGLDKLYRLHKDLGIGAGLLIFTHWMIEWLPRKLVKFGLLAPRPRGPRGGGGQDFWIGLAKDVGEWAGYILLALVVIALIKRIPYRYFRWIHKTFGAIFLAGVFHGLMLMPKDFWLQPLGWLTAAVAAVGVVPALLSLAGRIGRRHRHPATIVELRQHAGQIAEIVCRPANWPGHQAGQFLLADFGTRGEGAHPFTIASAWDESHGTLTLAVKALGDFTTRLPKLLTVGAPLTLEGPYGRFDFAAAEAAAPQVWVAGGIGITPFLARLEARAAEGRQSADTDLFYCTPQDSVFPERLDELCRQAGVRLHRRVTERDGVLTTADVEACLRPDSSVWFCGPAAWGRALGRALTERRLPPAAFHQEAFEFR